MTLQSKSAQPITGVTEVVVTVKQGTTLTKTLTYPARDVHVIDPPPAPPASPDTGLTLSVSFSGGQTGGLTLDVEAHDTAGCIIGTGTTTAVIKKGALAGALVQLAATLDCGHADGGAADAGPDAGFPGCDPVQPACGANMTCQVNCAKRIGECTMGGSGAPGTPCAHNTDCIPGTQCFDYSTTGCNVKVCLRFCNDTGQCAQMSGLAPDGGATPGSVCEGPVQCNGAATAYRTCTFSCDPRAAAVGAGSGCPTGLACLVVGNMDQVDCACPEGTRTKTEGQDCARAADCAPGLICNMMSGSQKCRPVCRCGAQGLTCGAAENDCPTVGTRCVPLTNDTLYGVCM